LPAWLSFFVITKETTGIDPMENAARGEMKFQTGMANNVDHSVHHDTRLNELRLELDRAAAEWASFISEGAARGVRVAKESVQERPWTAVALAAAIGAAVAIALVAPRQAARPTRTEINRDQRMREARYAHTAAGEPQPLSARFLQAWDSIATLNATALPNLSPSTLPSFETLAGLAKSFWSTQSQSKPTT
jgi:ElaB/YqjD/DUF883 family membrane-anchored ribosome-binding protein